MKRRMKQWLALVLTFMMVFSTGIVAVQAAENVDGSSQEVSAKPELSSKTADTVVLKAKDGYSYAVQITKDNVKQWKWADEKQYDKKNGTVSFGSLTAAAEYAFAGKKADAADVKDTDILKVTTEKAKEQKETPKETAPAETQKPAEQPKAEQPAETPKAEEPKAEESKTEEPKAEEAKVEEPKSEEPKAEEPKAEQPKAEEPKTEQPKAEEPKVEEPKAEETKAEETKTELPKTDEPNNDMNKKDASDKTGESQAPQLKAVTKKLETPGAPKLIEDKTTDTSITVVTADNAVEEPGYTFQLTEKGAQNPQPMEVKDKKAKDQVTFDGLKPGTGYEITVQAQGYTAADTTVYTTSDKSQALSVTTKKAGADAPAKPELAKKTNTSIQLKAVDGMEYGCIVDKAEPTAWNQAGLFENLVSGKEYGFVARKAFNEKEQMPGKVSEVLSVSTLKAAAEAPSAPKYTGRTENSVTLETVSGQEYAVLANGAPVKWQTNGTFSGLKANTSYEFVARKTYNPDEAMESKVSESTRVKTLISFDGSSVSGIKENGVYDKNAVLNIAAAGNGLDNSKPSVQDTRWVPESWGWSQEKGTWSKSPYTAKLNLKKSGNAELKVVFHLEEYTSEGWKAMKADTKSITVPFRVKEEYTITASVGSGGKISPTGKVKVMEGNDQTFTITANKGYNLSQVKVDGKVVSVKNGKYTFSDVKGNHTISVTFKKAVTTTKTTKKAPKTGDENNILGLLALMAVSAAAAGGIIYAGRRKKRH